MAVPETPTNPEGIPTGWSDDPIGVSVDVQYEFVSKREKVEGSWTVFSAPTLWAKYSIDGAPGQSILKV